LIAGLCISVVASAGLGAAMSHRPARWLLSVAGITGLLMLRHDFPAVPHPRRVRVAAQVAAAGVVVLVVHTGWLLFVGRETADAFSGRVIEGSGGALGMLAAMIFVAALAIALAASPAPPPDTPTQRARVAALVAHPDSDSLAPFITRADKTYVFSPD